MNTIKTAVKIGAGLVALGAVAGAAAAFWASRRGYGEDFDLETTVENLKSKTKGKRKEAFNGIVRAGKDMKDAWSRIQENAKIITKSAVDVVSSSVDDSEASKASEDNKDSSTENEVRRPRRRRRTA